MSFSDEVVVGDCPAKDTIYRTWTATDECGTETSQVQVITRIDTVGPMITVPSDTTISCSVDTLATTTGEIIDTTDNCSSITVSFSDEVVVGDCPAKDTISRTWTAKDECGNESSEVQVFTRIDTVGPMFAVPSDTTIACTVDTLATSSGEILDTTVSCLCI
mgnify:CR=1 FL=1